jgi:two-component system chemotaxis response regulator CheB
MRDAGSRTIAQDEATSIVWGMPGEAVAVGGAADVLPLDNIWSRVLQLADEMDITRSAESGVIQTLQQMI